MTPGDRRMLGQALMLALALAVMGCVGGGVDVMSGNGDWLIPPERPAMLPSVSLEAAVTRVYQHLLWHHLDASRKDFDGPDRKRLFDLIEAYRGQFPDECKAYEEGR